jgi:hypothetical protein
MSHYIVKCSYDSYEHNHEFVLCLTRKQFDTLNYKISNGKKYTINYQNSNVSEDVQITISSHKKISSYTYNEIYDVLENKYITDQLDNKHKLIFWYIKTDDVGGNAIIDDFIKNKLNKLEHKDYTFEFVFGSVADINISQKFAKIILSYGLNNSITGIDLQQDKIINFLLTNRNI